MPWKCPACGLSIQQRQETPQPNVVYRCHVCRLELVFDSLSGRLDVPAVPFPEGRRPSSGKKPR